jgi:hypothetical protein
LGVGLEGYVVCIKNSQKFFILSFMNKNAKLV